jgi:hypothetical protein
MNLFMRSILGRATALKIFHANEVLANSVGSRAGWFGWACRTRVATKLATEGAFRY